MAKTKPEVAEKLLQTLFRWNNVWHARKIRPPVQFKFGCHALPDFYTRWESRQQPYLCKVQTVSLFSTPRVTRVRTFKQRATYPCATFSSSFLTFTFSWLHISNLFIGTFFFNSRMVSRNSVQIFPHKRNAGGINWKNSRKMTTLIAILFDITSFYCMFNIFLRSCIFYGST